MTEAARRAAWLIAAIAFAVPSVLPAAGQGVRDLLQTLAVDHGFEIEGLALIPNEPVETRSGDLRHRLKRLLGGYNYLVFDNDRGTIERIVILPRGEAGDLPAVGLPTADPVPSIG